MASAMAALDDHILAALQAATQKTTHKHRVAGTMVGKVTDVYDGDTVWVALPFRDLADPNQIVVERVNVRMLGYDAPEMTKDHRPFGIEVRDVLRRLVLDRLVVLEVPVPKKDDPYGRVLGRLYVRPVQGAAAAAFLGGGEEITVRGHPVAVPPVHDLPSARVPPEYPNRMLCVNDWLLTNTPIVAYGGEGARPGYSAEELEKGYGRWPPRQ